MSKIVSKDGPFPMYFPDAAKQLVAPKTCVNWRAVHDWQPMHENYLYVTGVCEMPTPGYQITLERKAPQGINPAELILTKRILAPQGPVPEVITPAPVHYQESTPERFKTVRILPDNTVLDVQDVQ